MLAIGQKVLILDNAFKGSNDPRAIAVRGKIGTVDVLYDAEIGEDQGVEILIDGKHWPLCASELKAIEDR